MKIAFYRHSLLSRGGDKMFLFYANKLAEKGHEVWLFVNEVDTIFDIGRKIQLKKITFPGKIGTIIYALTTKFASDVIVADIIPLVVLLSVRNRKILYFAQDLDSSYYTSKILICIIHILFWWALWLKRIPTVAVSSSLADELKRFSRSRIEVVPNGIDPESFYPDPDDSLISIKEDRKAILILSRDDYRKGFDIAQDVVGRLTKKDTLPFEVWTVGEKAEGKFQGIIHRDFGYVEESELRRIMSSADVFLYPSRHEGFSLMILEAYACRCPVLTTQAVPIARNNINALVCEIDKGRSLTDNLIRLLRDEDLCQQLTTEGYIFAQKMSLKSASDHFEDTLLTILREDL